MRELCFIFKGFVEPRDEVNRWEDSKCFVPARIKKEAGLLRAFEFRPNAPNGRQTIAGIRAARGHRGEQAGAFNGVVMAHYHEPDWLVKELSLLAHSCRAV